MSKLSIVEEHACMLCDISFQHEERDSVPAIVDAINTCPSIEPYERERVQRFLKQIAEEL